MCKYTPPLLLDVHGVSVAALGRLRVDKSKPGRLSVYWPFWQTDPFWVPRGAFVTFLAKMGISLSYPSWIDNPKPFW